MSIAQIGAHIVFDGGAEIAAPFGGTEIRAARLAACSAQCARSFRQATL